ncbi:MAG: 5-formyltetrahydrofolate cyclo-ligase [Proteobacteria bacterium]|nr:5-formyltetrahydrofolate cyclo-ligase [Pseudomonadota bacterium]
MKTKEEVRLAVARRIASLPPAVRQESDRLIDRQLRTLAVLNNATAVVGYLALADEVDVGRFLDYRRECGSRIYLPSGIGAHACFREWRHEEELVRGETGGFEPDPSASELEDESVMLVPGRAFDGSLARLGRGGGWYDRVLAGRGERDLLVGVSYSCQLVAAVPVEAHDKRMELLVSEQQLLVAGT